MAVNALTHGLDHPRWLYDLPSDDVLVAETNAPPGDAAIWESDRRSGNDRVTSGIQRVGEKKQRLQPPRLQPVLPQSCKPLFDALGEGAFAPLLERDLVRQCNVCGK